MLLRYNKEGIFLSMKGKINSIGLSITFSDDSYRYSYFLDRQFHGKTFIQRKNKFIESTEYRFKSIVNGLKIFIGLPDRYVLNRY